MLASDKSCNGADCTSCTRPTWRPIVALVIVLLAQPAGMMSIKSQHRRSEQCRLTTLSATSPPTKHDCCHLPKGRLTGRHSERADQQMRKHDVCGVDVCPIELQPGHVKAHVTVSEINKTMSNVEVDCFQKTAVWYATMCN